MGVYTMHMKYVVINFNIQKKLTWFVAQAHQNDRYIVLTTCYRAY